MQRADEAAVELGRPTPASFARRVSAAAATTGAKIVPRTQHLRIRRCCCRCHLSAAYFHIRRRSQRGGGAIALDAQI